jgi:hypothetical protein
MTMPDAIAKPMAKPSGMRCHVSVAAA